MLCSGQGTRPQCYAVERVGGLRAYSTGNGRANAMQRPGWETAMICSGQGWETAMLCSGQGWETAMLCSGQGWETAMLCSEQGWETAMRCSGQGWETAMLCSERGERLQCYAADRVERLQCYAADSVERLQCYAADRVRDCNAMQRTGWETAMLSSGRGERLQFYAANKGLRDGNAMQWKGWKTDQGVCSENAELEKQPLNWDTTTRDMHAYRTAKASEIFGQPVWSGSLGECRMRKPRKTSVPFAGEKPKRCLAWQLRWPPLS